MIVLDDGCYEYHLHHQDIVDAMDPVDRDELEVKVETVCKTIQLIIHIRKNINMRTLKILWLTNHQNRTYILSRVDL